MEGNTSETPINSDAYASAYVQELKDQIAALGHQLRILEARLSSVDANLSTNFSSLQSVMQGQSQALTNETTIRAKLIQGVAHEVSDLRRQHSTDHAFIIGELERHHAEYDQETASIRASLSEERSVRAQGDAEVLAVLKEQAEDAEWYYTDTKAHLAMHDQALDDTTWDSTELTFDNDDYRFGWSILSAAQEWEVYIGEYISQVQHIVDERLRKAETTLIQASKDATQALQNTDIENLLDALQGQIGIEALDNVLWGKIESLTSGLDREVRERIEEATLLHQTMAQNIVEVAHQNALALVEEMNARLEADAANLERAVELAQIEALERADAVASEAAARKAEIEANHAALTKEINDKATALTNDYTARISGLRSEVSADIQSLNDGVSQFVSELQTADAEIIKSLNAYKLSNNEAVAAVSERVDVVITEHSATAQTVSGLVSTVGDHTADIAEIKSTAATESRVVAEQLAQLTADMQASDSSLSAKIADANTAITTLDSSTATKFEQLEAEITDKTDEAKAAAAEAKRIADSAVTTNTAQASDITSLKGRVTTAENNIKTKADTSALNALTTEVSGIGDEVSAHTTQLSEITASLEQTNDELGTVKTSAANAQTTANSAVSANTALASRVDALSAMLTDLEEGAETNVDANAFNALKVNVNNIEDRVEANTSDITSLETTLNSVQQGVSGHTSAISQMQTTQTNQGKSITQLVNDTTVLKNDMTTVKNGLSTKADASAMSDLVTRVEEVEGVNTSQGSALTNLQNSLNTTNANVAKKADTAALNSLQTKVTQVEGKTTTNASNITSLTGRVSTVEGNVAKKADATALNNYYTKTEADTKATSIAAGEISKYDAKLQIGGVNLFKPDMMKTIGLNSAGTVATGSDRRGFYIPVQPGEVYSISRTKLHGNRFRYAFTATEPASGVAWFGGLGTSTAYDGAMKIEGFVVPEGAAYLVFYLRYGSTWVDAAANEIKLERGHKATDMTESPEVTQAAIDANATAIENTNSEVTRINGEVTSHTSSISKLQSDLSATDTKAGTAINNAATAQTTANTAVNKANANATSITNLTTRMSTAEGKINKKADASALGGYYTKNEADTAIAGQINQFKSSITIGGVNQVLNSEAERSSTASTRREYLMYENSNHLYNFYEANLGKDVTISFDLKVAVAGSVQVYCSNGTHHTFSTSVNVAAADVNKWVRYSVTVQPKKHSTNNSLTTSAVEFYGIYDSGRIPYVRKVQVEAGSFATDWSPSPRDVQAALDVNATAISNVYTKAETNSAITSATNTLKSQVDQNIASQNSTINAWVERNKVEAVMVETLAAELVPHMAGNTELFADMEINVGYQGVITALADTDASIMGRIDEMESRYDNAFASIGTSEEIRTTAEEAAAEMATTIRAEYKAADTATKNAAVSEAATAMNNALKNYTTTASLKQNYYTKTDANTAIANATTTLQSSIKNDYTNAINAIDLATVSIPDTRSANETPQWYWTKYARKKITEFKYSTTVGLTNAQVGNTYGTLTTIVPWNDSSGGPIRQIMEGSSEANVYVRVSTGTTTWGPWTKQGATLDVKIQEQAQAVNGVRGIKTVTIDNNGVMSGYGLVSDLVDGKVTSAFGVNADQFYVGSPKTGKKVFAVVNGTTVINDAVIGTLSANKITTGTMHGDRITAGTISADRLSTTAISTIALEARSGTFTAADGSKTVITGGLTQVFYPNGQLAIKIGV